MIRVLPGRIFLVRQVRCPFSAHHPPQYINLCSTGHRTSFNRTAPAYYCSIMATTSKKPLKFRNYRPADASLVSLSTATSTGSGLVPTGAKSVEDSAACVPRPNEVRPPPAHAENNQGEEQPKKAEDVKKDEEDAIQRELKRHEAEHGSGGQLNVAPRKANWDLKRDVAKKLAKLNRLTQKAIIEILQEKLAQEAEEGSTSENDDDMSKEGDE